jgi:uncharacterized membrane protein
MIEVEIWKTLFVLLLIIFLVLLALFLQQRKELDWYQRRIQTMYQYSKTKK